MIVMIFEDMGVRLKEKVSIFVLSPQKTLHCLEMAIYFIPAYFCPLSILRSLVCYIRTLMFLLSNKHRWTTYPYNILYRRSKGKQFIVQSKLYCEVLNWKSKGKQFHTVYSQMCIVWSVELNLLYHSMYSSGYVLWHSVGVKFF